ncbi:MAG: TonB-dependent receptor domain-containing protein [Endozoicomonas sp.]|uniref:TonB-dependent receptor domain-containing protein n=1 Tax=Endozoicomonas sp. TaxID=1892382 RepID=UPI003D9BE116
MFRRTALSTAIVVAMGVSAGSNLAFAAEQEVEKLEKIQVTGSRISRVDVEGSNPVQVITRDQIVQSGLSSVGDLLQELPSMAGAATSSQVNNGGSGAARVSLRGLGSARTLVLVNGRRFVASGTGADSTVDLQMIPIAMVERVEILKDGASAVYGSDAIAGVVNIITKKNFDGVETNFYYGKSSEGDGDVAQVDITAGKDFERGSLVFSFSAVQQKKIMAGDRKFSENDIQYDESANESYVSGSSATPWGYYKIPDRDDNLGIDPNDPDGRGMYYTYVDTDADGSADETNGVKNRVAVTIDNDGNPIANINGQNVNINEDTVGTGDDAKSNSVTRVVTKVLTYGPEQGDNLRDFKNPDDLYNYQPDNYIQTPSDRYYANLFGDYILGNAGFLGEVRASAELSYAKRKSTIQLAPEPLFGAFSGVGGIGAISKDNVYNPTGEDISDWRRRMVDTGPRILEYDNETYRSVLALDGQFQNDWNWELFYNYGKNTGNDSQNSFLVDRLANSIGPTNAQGQCLDGNGNVISGCTPFNMFGTPSQAAIDYVTYVKEAEGENKQENWEANVNGDLFELPAGTVGFAAGYSWRKESGAYTPDQQVQNSNDVAGLEAATSGSYTVKETFGELAVPLIEGKPFIQSLDASLAVRYSDYNTFGDTTNWSYGLTYRPNDELMLRGTLSEAFRAPSVSELYSGTVQSAEFLVDPTGQDDRTQFDTNIGGNSSLQPETAEIKTFGFVYSPEAWSGFSATFDIWDIVVDDAIMNVGAQYRLNQCASSGQYCDSITRNNEGQILFIEDSQANVGKIEARGADINLRYKDDYSFGQLVFSWDLTYLDQYDVTQVNGDVIKYAGRYRREAGDAGGNFARWRSTFATTWIDGPWTVNYGVRYIHHLEEEIDPAENRFNKIDSIFYHDVRASYLFSEWNTTVSVGIENLFDEQPPQLLTGFNANTDDRTYDTTGRFVYLNLNSRF